MVYAAVFLLGVWCVPRYAEAGMLSLLARLFTTAPIEVEERFSPDLIPAAEAAAIGSALSAENHPPLAAGWADAEADTINVVQDNALVAPLNPLGILTSDVPPAGHIFVYTIRPGDTINGIARSFGVSVNTILWANNVSNTRRLKAGDELIILPVSGVRHEVAKGETVSSIARRYRASIEDILRFNGLAADDPLARGATIVIPNGEFAEAAPLTPDISPPRSFANLPRYDGYYLRPIVGGRRSRGLHGYNGVDFAQSCGLEVRAAADGQVLIARASGWNGGYGRYAVMSHPNGTQTLYAHLSALSATPGQGIRQGEVIGAIGSSGNSTGCHVHFEVRGARNPF